ncbi:MAG: nucleoside deaminase [Collinsella sp.]
MTITEIDEKFMREALAGARRRGGGRSAHWRCGGARRRDVARAHNRASSTRILRPCRVFGPVRRRQRCRWRLSDCTVYVTLEPCCMCAGLMVNARVGRCVYGAADAKAGALGSLYDLNADSRLNHRFNVTAGVLADECRAVLSGFFAGLRGADGVTCGRGLELDAHAAHAEALAGAGEDVGTAVDFGPACRRPRRAAAGD